MQTQELIELSKRILATYSSDDIGGSGSEYHHDDGGS